MGPALGPLVLVSACSCPATSVSGDGPREGAPAFPIRGGWLPSGGASSSLGSSGGGAMPLLAVLSFSLMALLYRGRLWALYEFFEPYSVTQLIPERPG
jgi:hypothetical protein